VISSRTVTAPDGTIWTIRRHWAPKPRWRGRSRPWRPREERDPRRSWGNFLDFPNFDFGDDLAGSILVIVGLILLVVFMIFIGWPLLLFLFETLLIIPITFVAGVAGRVLFRRPWTIEATGPRRVEWKVVGWRASSRAADRMEKSIAATGGVADEPPDETPRAHRKAAR
jgi:hypothetical protein